MSCFSCTKCGLDYELLENRIRYFFARLTWEKSVPACPSYICLRSSVGDDMEMVNHKTGLARCH